MTIKYVQDHHEPGKDYLTGEKLYNRFIDSLHEGIVTLDKNPMSCHENYKWSNESSNFREVLRFFWTETQIETDEAPQYYEAAFTQESFLNAKVSKDFDTIIMEDSDGNEVEIQFYFPNTRRVFQITE